MVADIQPYLFLMKVKVTFLLFVLFLYCVSWYMISDLFDMD